MLNSFLSIGLSLSTGIPTLLGLLCIFLLAPAAPFLLYRLLDRVKRNEKPWLECILLAISGCIFTFTLLALIGF